MPHKWEYGSSWQRHPVNGHIVLFEDGSQMKVHDIFERLPAFMLTADTIFVDPPWNQGNMSSFYTKADLKTDRTFVELLSRVHECIREITPQTVFLEIGKEYLADVIVALSKIYPRVMFYNNTYYKRRDNKCYIVHAGHKAKRYKELEDMDEADAIAWICKNHPFEIIGDFCMGLGLVAINAAKNKKKFVGTELNHKRLSATVEAIHKIGLKYQLTTMRDM